MASKEQETSQKIQELQILEQNLQNLLVQKQAFQLEMNETQNALGELEKSGDEVFKVVGQLMIKSEKSKMKQDLKDKEKMLDLRLKSLEKQEATISEKAESVRQELMKDMKNN